MALDKETFGNDLDAARMRHLNPLHSARRPAAPTMKRLFTAGLMALALVLLIAQFDALDWRQVAASLASFPVAALLGGVALTALSYAIYCSFDLLGQRYTGHALTKKQVLKVSFVSYAFGLNFGVAGVGLRYRWYSLLGVGAGVVARVYAVCLGTNWLGFALLAGCMLAGGLIALPAQWRVGAVALQASGIALLACALGYLLACAKSRRRSWTVRGHRIALPSLRFSLLQSALSILNWLLIAGVLYALLRDQIAFAAVLGTLLVSSLALAIIDVPGGLGVTEAVFIAALGTRMPAAQLLAGLAAYRLIYFLAPLVPAALMYLAAERRLGSKPT
jgi:glycosyltransferase 2 family protein